MQAQPPKVFFFDIGGVLLTNGWGHESRQMASKQFGYDYEEVEVLHNFIFNVYEIGSITLEEYLDRTVFCQKRDFSKEEFTALMLEQSRELPDMLKWLKEWKQENTNYPIISINNEGKELNEHRIKEFVLGNVFDAFVSSCVVKMRKPDPAIFELAMGIAQARPDECVYFDDRPMLVEAAGKLGIRAYHHTGFESTKDTVENLTQKES